MFAYAPALSREGSPYGEGDGFAASQAASDAAHEVVKAVGGVDEESAEAVSAYGDAAVAEDERAVAGADDGSPGQGGHRACKAAVEDEAHGVRALGQQAVGVFHSVAEGTAFEGQCAVRTPSGDGTASEFYLHNGKFILKMTI